MAENNVQATRKGTTSKRPLMARIRDAWNSYLALPINRRLMRIAILKHTGRCSGRIYATPVAARPTATGFVVPLTFGEKADWYRNALAANGCVVRDWKGAQYRLIDPQIVSPVAALPAFSPVERLVMQRIVGIKQYIQFRYASVGGEDS
jgi:deazaflavin-dependent oxidoreductase (nitroreductase family)